MLTGKSASNSTSSSGASTSSSGSSANSHDSSANSYDTSDGKCGRFTSEVFSIKCSIDLRNRFLLLACGFFWRIILIFCSLVR